MNADAAPDAAADARCLALLDQLLDTEPAARSALLCGLAAEEAHLRPRLERLLRAADAPTQAAPGMAALLAHAGDVGGLREGERIAGYRLIHPLGEGGMSVVWLAERADGMLKREVALKLSFSAHLSEVLAARFAREREVLAALDHPNIARLYDAGVTGDGKPYIVMEVIHGQPLTQWAAAKGISVPERLRLFAQVLDAIAHAHARMVVHRDIKPANILVDELGAVKLLDFGIAKLLDSEPGQALTQDVASVLTPRYATPEQVLGQPVTAATDVFAAGAVLHELLTGTLPHGSASMSVAAMLKAVVEQEVRPPGISADIDTVLLKALAKSPADRYSSAERFAEDVRRLVENRPIQARRVPPWRRAWMLVQRHRLASAAVTMVAGLLLAIGASAWVQADQARQQRLRADAVRDFVYRMVADAEPAEGKSEVTGVEMLDASVLRARQEIVDPRQRGELLVAIGRIYSRLRREAAARSTLTEALDLLARSAPSADPMLNQARASLALAVQEHDGERAIVLARQAIAGCASDAPPCAKARADARYSLTVNLSWQAHDDAALAQARLGVADARAGYGAASNEHVAALELLTNAALNTGQHGEAAAAIAAALALADRVALRATGRARLDATQANVDMRFSRHDAARERLRKLPLASVLWYEQAARARLLASAELALGHHAEAMRIAEASISDMPAEWQHRAQAALARIVWASAATRAGLHAQALEALSVASADLLADGHQEGSALGQRVGLARAEVLLRFGQAQAALDVLAGWPLRSESARATEEQAVLHLLRACGLHRLGQLTQAANEYDRAEATVQQALPAGHVHRRRVAAMRSEADCRAKL